MNDNDFERRCASLSPVEDAGSFSPGTVFGDWRVTAFIGRGGNGEVYCAEHTVLGMSAAVKILVRSEDRAKARFVREAKILAQLKSSAFPRFYAFGEANGTLYLAMELLEPGELPAGDRATAKFMLNVCEAVGELHALGFVHRDIKPGNILWRGDLEPVLSDLGLVKALDLDNSQTFRLSNPQITLGGVGTPGYGAPEQMERGEATVVSDIHALGVLADACFRGKPPRAWKRIVERATSSIAARRHQSVAALARSIRLRHVPKFAAAFFFVCAVLAVAFAVFPRNAERPVDRWLVESDEFISNFNNWYANVYGKEHVEKENAARERFMRAASEADEIARLRSAGKPVSAEEYSRLENELTNLVERLEFFRGRWRDMQKQWEKEKKGGALERQAIKNKPTTIQLLEMYEKRIRACLDERPPSNSD